MKKTNIITLLSFIFLIIAVILFLVLGKTPKNDTNTKADEPASQSSVSETHSESSDKSTSPPPSEEDIILPKDTTISMDDALFIGDSRTVGLSEYSKIDGADFFANVGMSVYNIHKKTVSVPTVGKVTLTELLSNKKYGKVYIMLGVNEIGYDFDKTVAKYKELITFIQEKQPDAKIFIEANLHVAEGRSDSDAVVNNGAINSLNASLSKLADGKDIYYLDANTVFDDENGNLSSEKTEDQTHLYAKYYAEWGTWIVKQTTSLFGEDYH